MSREFCCMGASGSTRSRRLALSWLPALIAMLACLGSTPAFSHAFDPSLLELRQQGETVQVTWKTPVAILPSAEGIIPIEPHFSCPAAGPVTEELSADARARILTWTLDCGADGTAGEEIRFTGLTAQGAQVMVRWIPEEGSSVHRLVDAGEPTLAWPEAATAWDVAGSYLYLGVEHIWGGLDHLAFVLGLILLVRGRRRALVLAITAFTLGHSVTLVWISLGLAAVAGVWVEVAIAASIFWLAVELSRSLRRSDDESAAPAPTWFQRHPWLTTASIGLLHGCGFAGALREIGLPEAELPLALATFNLGVEVGQLLFVAACLSLVALASKIRWTTASRQMTVRWATVYLLGSVSVYWMLDRVLGAMG